MTNTSREGLVSPEDLTEIDEPPLYRVLLHNDDYTTMDFVVAVLEDIFHKPHDEAVTIMLQVHNEGVGIAGIYTKEVGETKISLVHELAEKSSFPLRCSLDAA